MCCRSSALGISLHAVPRCYGSGDNPSLCLDVQMYFSAVNDCECLMRAHGFFLECDIPRGTDQVAIPTASVYLGVCKFWWFILLCACFLCGNAHDLV